MNLSDNATQLLIEALEQKIAESCAKLERERAETFLLYKWLKENKPGIVRDWVEYVYANAADVETPPKDIVAVFHDETEDLSKIKCTGDDFKAWDDA